MNILNCLTNIWHSKDVISSLSEELELYKTLIDSTDQSILILDQNRCITHLYNANAQDESIPLITDVVGKNLSFYKDDPTSPFRQACTMFDEVFDKVFTSGTPVELTYKVFDSYLKAEVSRIYGQRILILIHDITSIVLESQALEQNNNKELSMALTAGGITSWRYDVKTRVISSSHKNNVIGESMPVKNLLSRALPQYRDCITTMFDDIIHHKSQHCNITIQIKSLNGDIQWTEIHAIPHQFTPNGKVSIVMGSQKNVTQEYENAKKIEHLNKQNELVLNNIKSGLVYISPNYEVIWENVSKVFHDPSVADYYKRGTHCYEGFQRTSPCPRCVMTQAMQTLKPALDEFSNGAGLFVEALANPLVSENGVIEGVILRIEDITQKKIANKQLKEMQQEASSANQLLTAIIDKMPSSLFVKDTSNGFKYVMANKKYCQDLGLTEAEIIGKTDYDLYNKEDADRYRAEDVQTVELHQTTIVDGERIFLKGREAIWYTIKTPLVNVEESKLLIVIGVDITENRKAYEELAIAKKKAEESDRLKSSFLANMSHEIRTPLNAIVGFSELMQSSNDEAEKAEYMRIIATNNELLLRLINDILDLSKLESGIVQLHNVRFDLASFFYELSAMMQRMITTPDIEFIAINPYQSCIIETDKTRMTQVWHNFMTNAIKYTVSGYIKMGYEYINQGIKIYIEDTGIGVAQEKQNKLFRRFEKLDSFAQGTGLGLSICKAITELAGGKVGYETTAGKGSLFWSWIPVKAQITYPTVSQEAAASLIEPQQDTTSDREAYLQRHNYQILVAEDNDSNYQLINYMLKNNFQLFRAINGLKAVEFVRNNPIDLILMDVRMPLMDGLEATLEIRKFNNDVQIIALTANAFESDRDEALKCGCNGFITKPVRKKELIDTMFQICKHKATR